jgi:hypothetical protein
MGPHRAVPLAGSLRGFPQILKEPARNIVLRERAGDTNTQDNNYDHGVQRSQDPAYSPLSGGIRWTRLR